RPSPIAALDAITRYARPRRMSSPGHLTMVVAAPGLSSGAIGIRPAGSGVTTVIAGPADESGTGTDRRELGAPGEP
ncbi:MAG: hypothetical protein ACKN9D_01825, partial [Actinomycetales bacterium]